jgi:hypothetical protein
MTEYPMLHLLVRRGRGFALALALAVAAAGIWAAAASGQWAWAVAGIGAAAVFYGLLLSYVELVKLIIDMLLPKP